MGCLCLARRCCNDCACTFVSQMMLARCRNFCIEAGAAETLAVLPVLSLAAAQMPQAMQQQNLLQALDTMMVSACS